MGISPKESPRRSSEGFRVWGGVASSHKIPGFARLVRAPFQPFAKTLSFSKNLPFYQTGRDR